MSVTGLRNGDFDDVSIAHNISLTTSANDGTAGQVIVSGGADNPAVWGHGHGLNHELIMGTNLSLASGNPDWDATIVDTINATDTNTEYTAGDGLDLTGTTFSADLKSGSGLVITSGEIDLSSIPNSALANSTISGVALGSNLHNLTAGTNVSFSSGTTYNGSTAITINSTDTNTEYTAGDGIVIGGTTIEAKPDEDTIDFNGTELEVQKVPNSLSAGTNLSYTSGSTFDGAAARTINLATAPTNLNLTDSTNVIHPPNVFDVAGDLRMSIEMGNFYPNDDSSYFNIGVEDDFSAKIHGTLKVLTSSLEVCGYFIIPANYTATAVRIDAHNSSGAAVSRTIMCASVTTYGATGYTSLNFSGNTNAEFSLSPTMAGASDKIMLITIFTTSTSDHIRGGYIKLTR